MRRLGGGLAKSCDTGRAGRVRGNLIGGVAACAGQCGSQVEEVSVPRAREVVSADPRGHRGRTSEEICRLASIVRSGMRRLVSQVVGPARCIGGPGSGLRHSDLERGFGCFVGACDGIMRLVPAGSDQISGTPRMRGRTYL